MAFVFEHVKAKARQTRSCLSTVPWWEPRFVPGQPIIRPAVMWSLTFPAMHCSVCGMRKPAK